MIRGMPQWMEEGLSIQLVYVSEATRPMTASDLSEINEVARAHNGSHGITGALLYTGGLFLQVLEGGREPVWALYERIRKDERHHHVDLVHVEFDRKPCFPSWSMHNGPLTPDTADLVGRVLGVSSPDEFRRRLSKQSALRTALAHAITGEMPPRLAWQ